MLGLIDGNSKFPNTTLQTIIKGLVHNTVYCQIEVRKSSDILKNTRAHTHTHTQINQRNLRGTMGGFKYSQPPFC